MYYRLYYSIFTFSFPFYSCVLFSILIFSFLPLKYAILFPPKSIYFPTFVVCNYNKQLTHTHTIHLHSISENQLINIDAEKKRHSHTHPFPLMPPPHKKKLTCEMDIMTFAIRMFVWSVFFPPLPYPHNNTLLWTLNPLFFFKYLHLYISIQLR